MEEACCRDGDFCLLSRPVAKLVHDGAEDVADGSEMRCTAESKCECIAHHTLRAHHSLRDEQKGCSSAEMNVRERTLARGMAARDATKKRSEEQLMLVAAHHSLRLAHHSLREAGQIVGAAWKQHMAERCERSCPCEGES